jgi:phosphoribosylaminoimidazolecarboxamide formyltransferase / IMP cyclohydrolase
VNGHTPVGSPLIKVRRALISVSNKEGLYDFARALLQLGIEIISTGGTASALREKEIPVTMVSEVTGFPEIMDGRVKTLHPKIHGALLGVLDNPKHMQAMKENGIIPIDLVVVNLYPFEETLKQGHPTPEEVIEQIDIGGPAMLRSAAKNYRFKAVVVNPKRYPDIIREMQEQHGLISEKTRLDLACEVFHHTAHYDSVIASYFDSVLHGENEALPQTLHLMLGKSMPLRYGENPHQHAAFYGDFERCFQKLHGKELSFNNIIDINAAATLVAEFDTPTAVIIKHTNPCGVGTDAILALAYKKAFSTDMTSAYGGIVAVNRPLDLETARMINEIFTEVIIAPEFSPEVLDLLTKKKDRRLIKLVADLRAVNDLEMRKVAAGYLVQSPDRHHLTKSDLKIVTKRKPSDEEIDAMMFAWKVAMHVKSNAIVYARKDQTLGVGAGQMSRVDSSRIAAWKAKEAKLDLRGCAVASDAYFPFADGLLEAVRAGATAVVEPGGSIRDEEVIKAADDNKIAMAFTGIRHFKH